MGVGEFVLDGDVEGCCCCWTMFCAYKCFAADGSSSFVVIFSIRLGADLPRLFLLLLLLAIVNVLLCDVARSFAAWRVTGNWPVDIRTFLLLLLRV